MIPLRRSERVILSIVAVLVVCTSSTLTIRWLADLAGGLAAPVAIGLVFSIAQYVLPSLSLRALGEDQPATVQTWGAIAGVIAAALLLGSVVASTAWMLATDEGAAHAGLEASPAYAQLVDQVDDLDQRRAQINSQIQSLQATADADLDAGYRWRAIETSIRIDALRADLETLSIQRAQLGEELVGMSADANQTHGLGPLWMSLGGLVDVDPRQLQLGVYCLVSIVLEVLGTIAILGITSPAKTTNVPYDTLRQVSTDTPDGDEDAVRHTPVPTSASDAERRRYLRLVEDVRSGSARPTSSAIRSAMGCASDRVQRYRRWLVADGICSDAGGRLVADGAR